MTIESISETFLIGDYEFGIEKENCIIQIENQHIHELRIVGLQVNMDKLSSSEKFLFNWTSNPPEFYANDIHLGRKNHIIINAKKGYEHDSALYIGDHFDLHVNLSIHEEWILIVGFSTIDKVEHPIMIRMKKNNWLQQSI